MPKLSIIIPIYNSEKTLEKCLKQIISNDENIEIICINDGSEDNSSNIILNFQQVDNRIKFFNQKRHGVSYSRNVGLQNAKGEYIWFVDSDDYVEINAIKTLIDTINQHNDVECILFKNYDVTDNLKQLPNPKNKIWSSMQATVRLFDNIELLDNCTGIPCLWNKCFKKSLIDNNGINFYEHICYFEDGLFIMKYFLQDPKIFIIDNILYNYVYNENSITNVDYNKRYEQRKGAFYSLKDFIDKSKHNLNTMQCKCTNLFADMLLQQMLSLWSAIYFSEYKIEYLQIIKDFKTLFNLKDDLVYYKGYHNADLCLNIVKYHLAWFYWKIIKRHFKK